jgi:hypothetical protein
MSETTIGANTLRVAVIWKEPDEIGSLISSVLIEKGCEVINLCYEDRLPQELDVVLVYGPFATLVPLANQLLDYPPSRRPTFVLWMTEQFPNPGLPEWVRYPCSVLRSQMERRAFRQDDKGDWRIAPRWRWLTGKAHRFRYYGDLYWLQRQGILSLLTITSPWTADFLRARGLNPVVIYLGMHPSWGDDLGLERDIPVLWIGKIGSDRRRRLLDRIRADLREQGIEMLMIDGVEHPYVFGKERTILLNRTQIALNLLRATWDDNSLRYCLAAPNRTLIVTEPTLPHTAFKPGVHLVEAPIEKLSETICHYLSHQEERQQIVDRAYQLATTELTMSNAISQLLDRILEVRGNTQSN